MTQFFQSMKRALALRTSIAVLALLAWAGTAATTCGIEWYHQSDWQRIGHRYDQQFQSYAISRLHVSSRFSELQPRNLG